MTHELTLTLPLPPAPRSWPSHPMQRHRAKNEYRREAWVAALQQRKPPRHPPESVVATARLYLWNEMDEGDNLRQRLKWVWDTIRQEQDGKLHWRQGVADRCGYIVDDDPAHLHVASVEQEIDRDEQRVELTLRWVESEEAA